MVLPDRKQLQAEVKRPGCFLRDGQLVTAILRRPPSPAVIASDGSQKGGKEKIVTCEIWYLECEVLCVFVVGVENESFPVLL